jgi:hypothetical protein
MPRGSATHPVGYVSFQLSAVSYQLGAEARSGGELTADS